MYYPWHNERILITTSITDNEDHDSHIFVLLSGVTNYGSDVKEHLIGLVDQQDLPSVVELSDETWELLVHRLYVTELCTELKLVFPQCHVSLS